MDEKEGGMLSKLFKGFRRSEPAIPAPTPDEQQKIQERIDRYLPEETPESRKAKIDQSDQSWKAIRDHEQKKVDAVKKAKEDMDLAWGHTLNDRVDSDKPR